MRKIDEVRSLSNEIMETTEDFLDKMVQKTYGSLDKITDLDPETIELFRTTKELIDKSKKLVRVSVEAYTELSDIVGSFSGRLREIKSQLAVFVEKD